MCSLTVQRAEVQKLALSRDVFLLKDLEKTPPHLFQLPLAPAVPWLVATSAQFLLCLHVASSSSSPRVHVFSSSVLSKDTCHWTMGPPR